MCQTKRLNKQKENPNEKNLGKLVFKNEIGKSAWFLSQLANLMVFCC